MPHVDVKQIDHLRIAAGFCNQVELSTLIDGLVGKDNRKVSVGNAVKALIVNARGFTGRTLYLTPMSYRNRAVDLLIDCTLGADDFNNDSLGTALESCRIPRHRITGSAGLWAILRQIFRPALECPSGFLVGAAWLSRDRRRKSRAGAAGPFGVDRL